MTILDLRPSGLPIVTTLGGTRVVNFKFPTAQTGVFTGYIASSISSVPLATLSVSVVGDTVTMIIDPADTVAVSGQTVWWVLTLDGEPLLYDRFIVSTRPGQPTTSTVVVVVENITVEVTALGGGSGGGGGSVPYGVGLFKRSSSNQVVPPAATVLVVDTDDPPGNPLLIPQSTEGLLSFNATTGEFTVLKSGIYSLMFGASFVPLIPATGGVGISVYVDGVQLASYNTVPTGAGWQDTGNAFRDAAGVESGATMDGSRSTLLTAGAVVTLVAYPDSDTLIAGAANLWIARIA